MSNEAASQSRSAIAALPIRPGKIIAIHLSYESRAAQRGRRPANPSYFFKPVSSLGPSGGTIERPAGTELLAFEGEIALIMGTAARRISESAAWNAVGFVTAANDFGLYDLRAADKGSNVRSKGGDGFTPVGPKMIAAKDVDPQDIHVKTWVNGQLVQDDSSSEMIFSLPRIVADLSQHFTLEPGDIILTGTPAGSTVVGPGDVVEVEVGSGTYSSGKLKTTVVQGRVPFDPELGDVPAVDDKQRAEAWGLDPEPLLSEDQRDRLSNLPVAALSQQLRRMGLNNIHINGVHPMHPEEKLVGIAKTLRFLPNREDLFEALGGGHNAQKLAFDTVNAGEVIVIEARGEADAGTLGDVLTLRAKARGAAGVVTDGAVRDYAATSEVGLPIYSRGAHPAVLGNKHFPFEVGGTVACGGATVQTGDIIVGDSDGVIVIPPTLVQEAIEGAETAEASDAWVAQQVADGAPIQGLFPMNAEWKARYQQWQQRQ